MKKAVVALAFVLAHFFSRLCAASEGLDVPEALERKVPLDGLTGLSRFFASTYNDNLTLYAVICTVIMAIVGIVIAYGTDVILKAMGMEVHKIEHKE
ncbi:MAG: hypothetical protein HY897_08990 [Deltaproteobacteria bacterium]|nr:hypothetical protein [Deltaproteobacteria bacterium]